MDQHRNYPKMRTIFYMTPPLKEDVCSQCEKDAKFSCKQTGMDFCSYDCRRKEIEKREIDHAAETRGEFSSGGQI